MWFIGKHTRSLRDFLAISFPAFGVNKDKCPPTQRPLPLFFSYPLNKHNCVHTPYHAVTANQICPYPLGMKSVCLRPSSLVHSPVLMNFS